MGVSKNRGTPKWMDNGTPYYIMDDLVVPLFLETPICMVQASGWRSWGLAKTTPNQAQESCSRNAYNVGNPIDSSLIS